MTKVILSPILSPMPQHFVKKYFRDAPIIGSEVLQDGGKKSRPTRMASSSSVAWHRRHAGGTAPRRTAAADDGRGRCAAGYSLSMPQWDDAQYDARRVASSSDRFSSVNHRSGEGRDPLTGRFSFGCGGARGADDAGARLRAAKASCVTNGSERGLRRAAGMQAYIVIDNQIIRDDE